MLVLWLVALHSLLCPPCSALGLAGSSHLSHDPSVPGAFLPAAAPQQRPVGFLRRRTGRHAATRRYASPWDADLKFLPYGAEGSPEREIEAPFREWQEANEKHWQLQLLDIDPEDNSTYARELEAAEQREDAAYQSLVARLAGNDTLCWYLVDTYWAIAGDGWRGLWGQEEGMKYEDRRNVIVEEFIFPRQHQIDPNGTLTIEMFDQAGRKLREAQANIYVERAKCEAVGSTDPFCSARAFYAKQSRYDAWQRILGKYQSSPDASIDVRARYKQWLSLAVAEAQGLK
ncbi:unnamed protein product [Vitrella brassicaformis CCMP3155]|uniref:Uncharacterized protein n=1 Tax=Vitrella brassicaformis (strain CCMP3155) TaxID=1169540 RepID=A0A0G4EBP3_VITBC|nr:unnamed protein product [Vitrella brassicaformis CCMP3155]|eukprot:CEL92950.1 unnamed protein product [Vitrella brassicaformis CCMP3155]